MKLVSDVDLTIEGKPTNSLTQPITLHHHGMFFNCRRWMDGALGVSGKLHTAL